MIEIINQAIPKSNCKLTNSPNLFVVDYKHLNGGIVELLEEEPEVCYVKLDNDNNTEIYFNGFLDNALEIAVGKYSSQCECALFSNPYDDKSWILFIEAKYVNSLENAFRENNDYPNCMIGQIIDTVNYFRLKNLIGNETVNAIVSFPTLIQEFSAFFFTGNLTIESILLEHRIRIRATNNVKIISKKRIRL